MFIRRLESKLDWCTCSVKSHRPQVLDMVGPCFTDLFELELFSLMQKKSETMKKNLSLEQFVVCTNQALNKAVKNDD